jgi:hypothetical protein
MKRHLIVKMPLKNLKRPKLPFMLSVLKTFKLNMMPSFKVMSILKPYSMNISLRLKHKGI